MLTRIHRTFVLTGCALTLLLVACGGRSTTAVDDDVVTRRDTIRVPLTQLGSHTYLGFAGGLYEDGRSSPPEDHAAVGAARARNIQPRDADGAPAAHGKIVLLSIGMSNASQEFCGADITSDCVAGSFMQRASVAPDVNHSSVVLVNGAQGGMDAREWISPSARTFDVVRDKRLASVGVSENQVQAVWLLRATKRPTVSLPATDADAFRLETQLGQIVRALRIRYPHLQQVHISNRVYGGYATTSLNPEPYAYEAGFAVKWLVQAQVSQMRQGGQVVDTRAGDLNYDSTAPWIAWGPDLWADGVTPRWDGLTRQRADFKSDGTHPSVESGVPKVGDLLLRFFSTSPVTRCWFLAGHRCS